MDERDRTTAIPEQETIAKHFCKVLADGQKVAFDSASIVDKLAPAFCVR
jgi:hypothetical protein